MLPSPGQVHFMLVGTTCAEVRVRVDLHEHERRRSLGLGAVTNQRLLDVLMSLPIGFGVAVDVVDDEDRRVVRRAAAGIVDETAGEFVRRLVRPLVIESVRATAQSWRGVQPVISRFAAHCDRTVRLPMTEVDPLVGVEAEHLGVGIESADGDVVIAPRPFVTRRLTSYRWWFTEIVYAEWLTAQR